MSWTIDTLNKFLSSKIRSLEKDVIRRDIAVRDRADTALKSTQIAIDKADKATEKRFDSVNEFRSTLSDQARTFIPRIEAEQRNKSLLDRIDALDNKIEQITARIDRGEGRSGGFGSMIGWIIGAAGILLGVIGFLVK